MKLKLDLKPLSVNAAFSGRHFKTPECREFERLFRLLSPPPGHCYNKFVRVRYKFYLRYFATTDVSNLIKVLEDCICKRGYLLDDRLVVEVVATKFRAKEDRIEVEIEEVIIDGGNSN